MALVVQLISFKSFTGHGSEGKIHLRAATNISQKGFRDKLVSFDPNARAKSILCGDRLLSEEDGLAAMEVTLFKFFTGAIIWLDIISFVTAGTAPHLLDYHLQAKGLENQHAWDIGDVSDLEPPQTIYVERQFAHLARNIGLILGNKNPFPDEEVIRGKSTF